MDINQMGRNGRKPKSRYYAIARGRRVGVFSNKWSETELLVKYFTGARCEGFKESTDAWINLMNENKDIRLPDSLKESSKISESDLEILRDEVERDRLNKDLAKNATK